MASRQHVLSKRILASLVLAALSAQVSAADASLALVPSANPAVQGSVLDLSVVISDISDLYGYQFTLSFNAALLQATAVTEGAFLSSGGTTFASPGTIDNSLGTISFVSNTLLGAQPGVSGSGSLAKISFNVLNAGSSVLSLSDTLLLDSNLDDLTVKLEPLTLHAVAVPEPASYLLFGAGLAGLVALRRRPAKTT